MRPQQVLVFLDPRLELVFNLASGRHNQAVLDLGGNAQCYFLVPLLVLLELFADFVKVGVVLLPDFKVEAHVVHVHVFAILARVGLLFDLIQIILDSLGDVVLHLLVGFRVGDDRLELGALVSDKTVDELVEVTVVDHALDLLSHCEHCFEQRVDEA
jgi:hypothetical protein